MMHANCNKPAFAPALTLPVLLRLPQTFFFAAPSHVDAGVTRAHRLATAHHATTVELMSLRHMPRRGRVPPPALCPSSVSRAADVVCLCPLRAVLGYGVGQNAFVALTSVFFAENVCRERMRTLGGMRRAPKHTCGPRKCCACCVTVLNGRFPVVCGHRMCPLCWLVFRTSNAMLLWLCCHVCHPNFTRRPPGGGGTLEIRFSGDASLDVPEKKNHTKKMEVAGGPGNI